MKNGSKNGKLNVVTIQMSELAARGLYGMVDGTHIPNHGYEYTKQGIALLGKVVKGPFCAVGQCYKAGVVKGRKGLLVCEEHKETIE